MLHAARQLPSWLTYNVRQSRERMSTPAILFTLYLAAGLIVATVIMVTDIAKKRISAIGVLGDLATLHAGAFLLFLSLWPIWLIIILIPNDDGPNA
jgi:hypothetical protein